MRPHRRIIWHDATVYARFPGKGRCTGRENIRGTGINLRKVREI